MSKIVYVQQLGRGTRTAPGKEHLLVFDFIDNTTRIAQALNIHRLLKKREYRPGAFVLAPDQLLEEEAGDFQVGTTPSAISGLHLYAAHLEIVDVFRWQDEVAGMLQGSELAIELRVDDDTIRDRVRRGEIVPDQTIPIGAREYHYFRRERVSELQRQFGVEPLTAQNIGELFFRYVEAGDMSASYKPVLLLGMLACTDQAGRAKISDLVAFFRNFYLARLREGLSVEAPRQKMARVDQLTDVDIELTMLAMPFEKFERKRFFRRLKDIGLVRFEESLWRRLSLEDKATLARIARAQIDAYYRRIAIPT